MSVLAVDKLSKSFGGVRAAHDVSFAVEAGRLVALIGPNGAGKTTTFNIIGGQLACDSGRVLLAGEDVTGLPPRLLLRRGVGRTFQIAQAFSSMTVRENVQVAILAKCGAASGFWTPLRALHREAAMDVLRQVDMDEAAERLVAHLAYADIKRVEFALALAAKPRLLLMDEPTAGMALAERRSLMALVAAIARRDKIAVLFTEHDMDAVFSHADEVLALAEGAIVARGSPAEMRASPLLREIYLGRAADPRHGAAFREGAPS